MPNSRIEAFCSELTRKKWDQIESSDDVNVKTNYFHDYLRQLYEKHFPEKTVNISNLDKNWMTPQLKVLLRQAQRERLRHGKKGKFKQLWAKFRRLKRANIKSFYKKYVEEMKTTQPGKWYQMLKKLGGIEQMNRNNIEIESLKGMSDLECAEAVAKSFSEVSQSYKKLDRTQLPAFLPAGRPEQVTILQVMEGIRKMKSTKSTLPIDIPDKLRKECSVDLAEPVCNIINTCLRDGKFPVAWRREWVTPVPKTTVLKTCKDVRKIASTSDYSKLFETFLRKWIVEDIGNKIDRNQFAGKKGVGTEHMLVMLMDRVLSLLDNPGMSAVIMGAVDWMGAYDRTDPTKTVTKMISMGIRTSLIPILIEFLDSRMITVKEESKLHELIGGSPQGSWTGQNCYITSSDDAARWMDEEDRYKYCDDLSIMELLMIGNLLTDYDFYSHVASDIGIDQKYLPTEHLHTQTNLDRLSSWTSDNLMRLNENKTKYLIFNRARQDFSTRLSLNGQTIERQQHIKLLGIWLQEDGGWTKNTSEVCKNAYARLSLLTKLKYAGLPTGDLLQAYKMYIRSRLEYCSVVFHSSLTQQQEAALERCQAICLRVILQESYTSYSLALELCGLKKLSARRLERCHSFSLKCLKHEQNKRIFPKNPNLDISLEARYREQFKVNFARTNAYRNSAVPFCQRLLNDYFKKKAQEVEEPVL